LIDLDNAPDRRNTDSIKWRKYHGRDIIPMWVADMDFVSPTQVMEALHQRISHGVFGYGAQNQTLMATILDYLLRSFQWRVDPQWVIWLPGLVPGLNVACRSVGEAGDAVLTTVPVYPPFLKAPRNAGRRLITSRMRHSNYHWELDFDHLEKSIDDRTRLFILCNPHNPTGRVFTRDELTTLAHICLDRGLIICSDEIHCDLIMEPDCRHIPLASLSPEIASSTITLMAPSKTYNIPGLGCSFAVIPDDRLRRRFKRAMAGIVPHVNILGMVAAQAAYQYGGPWLNAVLDYLRKNRDMTARAVEGIEGLSMGTAQATYLAWIDARELNCGNPGKWFEAAGVGLSDGIEFDGPGFVRLNFGCRRALLSQALTRMTRAVKNLRPPENPGSNKLG
jgi:cysteine-S-conjugate beta-lyase